MLSITGYSTKAVTVLVITLIMLLNVIGFAITGIDKYKAKRKLWRIPEKAFFIVSIFGGSLGIYAGLLFFRHKTRHRHFMIGIPLIILIQIVIGLTIYIYK